MFKFKFVTKWGTQDAFIGRRRYLSELPTEIWFVFYSRSQKDVLTKINYSMVMIWEWFTKVGYFSNNKLVSRLNTLSEQVQSKAWIFVLYVYDTARVLPQLLLASPGLWATCPALTVPGWLTQYRPPEQIDHKLKPWQRTQSGKQNHDEYVEKGIYYRN